jgi:integrase
VWRGTLPPKAGHYYYHALRQVLAYAETVRLIDSNPAPALRLKKPKAREFLPFDSWQQVETLAEEFDSRYRAVPIVLVGTGLRPEELWALERRDLDLDAAVLTVERVWSDGELKHPKTDRSRRRVPLRARVLDALRAMPPRIDTPPVFPAPQGGHTTNKKFLEKHWTPALRAAGIEHRRIYDCRHTFASWAISDGVHLFELSPVMGTSIEQLDKVYGHLMPSWEHRVREQLDAGDEARAASL